MSEVAAEKSNRKVAVGGPLGIRHPLVGAVHKVPLGRLKVDEVRFQIRDHASNTFVQRVLKEQEGTKVSSTLHDLLERGDELDPVVYWKDPKVIDGPLWVIDGHHRMEAYLAADVDHGTKVFAQEFMGVSEADARTFALHVNGREHLGMTTPERHQALWLQLVALEVSGSARQLEQMFNVKKSTVNNMTKQVQPVRDKLRIQSAADGKQLTPVYVRENAPRWKDISSWRENDGPAGEIDMEDLDRKAVEAVVKALTVKYGRKVQAQPEVFIKAFSQFFQGATGGALSVRMVSPSEAEDGEFEF